jgi:hypothetical protein
MAGADSKLQLSISGDGAACYISPSQPGRGSDFMADDAAIEILKKIQASIVALDDKTQASLVALDEKFTRHHTILAQDVRMIRGGIRDMVMTRVTAGEVDVLHEDMSRMQLGLADLVIRMEAVEHPKK